MKILLAALILATFIYVTISQDAAGEAMAQASKCGEEIRGEYARLCKKFDNNGTMLMAVEEQCVKTPESLSKFPEVQQSLANCKKPELFCDPVAMEECGKKWISESEVEYQKRTGDGKTLQETVMTAEIMGEVYRVCNQSYWCIKEAYPADPADAPADAAAATTPAP